MRKIIYFFMFIVLIASAIAWTPPSDADFRNYYALFNVTNITANYFFGDGSGLTGVVVSNANYSTFANYSIYSGTSNYSTYSNYSDYSGIAINSSYSLTSNYSDYSNYSIYAVNSTYADSAATSVQSNTSNYSNFAVSSTYAGSATTADYSTNSNNSVYSNSSEYWDNLNTPADINAGDITNDGTYILSSDEGNLNVNSSDYWDNLNTYQTRWFSNLLGFLTFNEALLNDTIDERANVTVYTNISPIGLTGTSFFLEPCSDNELYFYNASSMLWRCGSVSGTGTVTSIGTGIGLTGGPITSSGTININKTYFDANYYNKTEADGKFLLISDEGNLNVNRSDYWDNLNTPADINAGDITNDGTYILTLNEGLLNVNKSNYWDNLNTPADFSWSGDLSGTGLSPSVVDNSHYHGSTSITDVNGSLIQNMDLACSVDTYMTKINFSDESITCTAAISSNYMLNTGDNVTGNYNFTSGTVNIEKENVVNITVADSIINPYNTSQYMKWNSSGCLSVVSQSGGNFFC